MPQDRVLDQSHLLVQGSTRLKPTLGMVASKTYSLETYSSFKMVSRVPLVMVIHKAQMGNQVPIQHGMSLHIL